ncbi:hypothetical protein [uncultured Parabacteroides sp.]|uniref:hypothetical protein n=1 Tax=uncultured Parabacteroides sp. TaxID=512312 RepID=UPI002608B7BE|nr:hypothetical protein [uncultured Parabacteroides sp.]
MRQIIQSFIAEAEKLKREAAIANEQWNDAVQQHLYDNYCYPMIKSTQDFTGEMLARITEIEQLEAILFQLTDKYDK